MRLSSVDIHAREFRRAFRGYAPSDVAAFCEQAADSFEEMQIELAELRKESEQLRRAVEHYKAIEKNLNDALVLAQRAAEDVCSSAAREADMTIRRAENQAAEILATARAQRVELERELAELAELRERFLDDFATLLSGFARRIEAARGVARQPSQPSPEESVEQPAPSSPAAPPTQPRPMAPIPVPDPQSSTPGSANVPGWLGDLPPDAAQGGQWPTPPDLAH